MREFVADVGNSRIKWGECSADGLSRTAALPLDNPDAWAATVQEWKIAVPSIWNLAGTNPEARDQLTAWIRQHGHRARIVDDARRLTLRIKVDAPEKVGIDRLLNAVAAISKVPRGTPIIVIDAGSAVTVDLIDDQGTFRGGAIFPGFRLMAKALHDYTARLPLIESFASDEPPPARNTESAIRAGIGNTIKGGIERIVRKMSEPFGEPRVFLAGGDAELLQDLSINVEMAGPFLTLEGIRLAARTLV